MSVQIFIFPEFLPNYISFSSPADSSSFVGLPCLLTHASCHFPCSPSLSPRLHHSHALFPCSSLLFGCRYHSYLQMPAAPHRGHVIQQSLPHQKKKNSIHASSHIYFLSSCLECINGFPASDCVCGLNVGSRSGECILNSNLGFHVMHSAREKIMQSYYKTVVDLK